MRIFITHSLGRSFEEKLGLSDAAGNFNRNLISGGGFDKVYCIYPSFVHSNPCIKDSSIEIVYSSWSRRMPFLQRFAPIIEQLSLGIRIPSESSIWLYNVTLLNAILILFLKIFKPKVNINAIILDYTPTQKRLSLNSFLLWLSNKVNGTILLAHSPLFTCRNSICLPGVVPNFTSKYARISQPSKSFLISGVLNENISMLSMLLSAFAKIPDATLHITGITPVNIDIRYWTSHYDNIIYHGKVTYQEYMHILDNVTFQLSTRDPRSPENQCNFPSKIIEALLHNRIVISTLSYKQLSGIRYFKVSTESCDFIEDIRAILSIPEQELLQYANQSDVVISRYNCNVWFRYMEQIEQEHANN